MMRGELLVAVVDGQGGGMGRGLVEAVKKKWPSLHVRALGTNSMMHVMIEPSTTKGIL